MTSQNILHYIFEGYSFKMIIWSQISNWETTKMPSFSFKLDKPGN